MTDFIGIPEMEKRIKANLSLTELQKANLRRQAKENEKHRHAIANKLPRKIRGQRCRALNKHGEQCKNRAIIQDIYLGENEIYDYNGPEPTRVLVEFCQIHTKEKPCTSTKSGSVIQRIAVLVLSA